MRLQAELLEQEAVSQEHAERLDLSQLSNICSTAIPNGATKCKLLDKEISDLNIHCQTMKCDLLKLQVGSMPCCCLWFVLMRILFECTVPI